MDNTEFKNKALRTEPTFKQYRDVGKRLRQYGIGVALITKLHEVQRNLKDLDDLKKYLYYGKPGNYINNFLAENLPALESRFPVLTKDNEKRGQSFDSSLKRIRILHGVLGIATESGELVEALIKMVDGQDADRINIMEEVADVSWYQALLSDALNFDMDEANEKVIDKLMKRFPDRFNEDQAKNRNLDVERATLEGNKI